MDEDRNIPRRLYKYRELSARTLDMIVGDNLYFADPSTFNDPLDTRPSLKIDLEEGELERVVRMLAEQRTRAELQAAAKTMNLKGAKTENFIEKRIRGKLIGSSQRSSTVRRIQITIRIPHLVGYSAATSSQNCCGDTRRA